MEENNHEYIQLTPRQIVAELDRHIVGQAEAKKAVAIALRNRWRRINVKDAAMREEIAPKNILMIGSTGIGKTEIARRLAKLTQAPFIKVEATKFTEVGYVGRDVDSIIRDLTEVAINMVREQLRREVYGKAREKAEERILDALVGETASHETRERFRSLLYEGKMGQKEIELEVVDNPNSYMSLGDMGNSGIQMGVLNLGDVLNKVMGQKKLKTKKLTVDEAYTILMQEESDKLLDEEKVIKKAIAEVENNGIVFIDEIDKIASKTEGGGRNADVSREGVQRDLLPLIEGSCVTTKYGTIKTDHILFIASGAFYAAKPSDLLPELQGRLPIRVELSPLSKEDMVRILREPENSLLKQYIALLDTEGLELEFTDQAVERIAELAKQVNDNVENIGARRLHTMLEKLLEEISFEADSMAKKEFKLDENYVNERLASLAKEVDLSKFIL